jgi:hypothetical protein
MTSAELASWIFGAVSLLYLATITTYLILGKRTDHLPPAANFILGFFCAVAGGFLAYFLTGTLGLNFTVPGTGIKGDAVGGLGVFVLVLMLWLRHVHRNAPDPVNQAIAMKTLEAISQILGRFDRIWMTIMETETGQPYTPGVKQELKGRGRNEAIHFTEVGNTTPLQVLTIEQVRDRLSDDEKQLLIDTEVSMRKKFDVWRLEYAKAGDPATADVEGKKRLLRIAVEMETDLHAIFNAIEHTLNGQLKDHYGRERWIADHAKGLLKQLSI